jgi:hypothetical protein
MAQPYIGPVKRRATPFELKEEEENAARKTV